ncbi:MAG: helix-turn-helix domain-containing protein [Thermoanaerobaculia bacterium]
MSNKQPVSQAGEGIRELRVAQGLSQSEVARALDISLRTVVRLEKEGRGHNLRRVRKYLEELPARTAQRPEAGAEFVRSLIAEHSVPGGRPLSLAFHELAALLDRLPVEQRSPAVETFIDMQRQLDDASLEPLKTLEAAAQITVKAFSQFVRHEKPE